jgi:hypothetical protein
VGKPGMRTISRYSDNFKATAMRLTDRRSVDSRCGRLLSTFILSTRAGFFGHSSDP